MNNHRSVAARREQCQRCRGGLEKFAVNDNYFALVKQHNERKVW